MVTPAAKRKAVARLKEGFGMSERRTCKAIGCCRMTVRYETSRPDDGKLRERMKAIAQERRRFGYRRLLVMLRREGLVVNHKKLFRLYREEKLAVRRRGGRKRAIGIRAPMVVPLRPDERWSLDFVSDQLTDGRRFRILAVVDDCTRRVPGTLDYVSLGHAGCPRIGPAHHRARPAENDRQRQWQRVHLERHPLLGGSEPRRMALHCARQADAEWLHRASTADCAMNC